MSPASIPQILPAALAGLGVPLPGRSPGALTLQRQRAFVVVLVDGLGAGQLRQFASFAPVMAQATQVCPVSSTFPSTTAAAITSFGTGLPVGEHGIVSAAFEDDDGNALWPLSWQTDPNPIATQPQSTVFELAVAAGVAVTSAGPLRFANSGLTRAALRGAEYAGAETSQEQLNAVGAALGVARRGGQPALVYVYVPEVDKAGHASGVGSEPYLKALGAADEFVDQLASLLGEEETLLVTADHGMIDVTDDDRVDLEANRALRVGVRRIMGEPRARFVYTRPGCTPDVAATWRRELAGVAEVKTRAEAASEWFGGYVDPYLEHRIGDLVVLPTGRRSLISERVDRLVSGLRGQHGGQLPDETEIPLLALRNRSAATD